MDDNSNLYVCVCTVTQDGRGNNRGTKYRSNMLNRTCEVERRFRGIGINRRHREPPAPPPIGRVINCIFNGTGGREKKKKKEKRKKRSTAKPGPISIHQGLRDNSQRHCGVTWPPIIAREMNRKFSMYKGSEMEEPNAGGFHIRSNGKYIEVRGKISRANIAGV